jgi:ribosomal protein L1
MMSARLPRWPQALSQTLSHAWGMLPLAGSIRSFSSSSKEEPTKLLYQDPMLRQVPLYTPEEAIQVFHNIGATKQPYCRFFFTLVAYLNINPKIPGQKIKGMLELPHSLQNPVKVCVLCPRYWKKAVKEAGALRAGEIADKLCIATIDPTKKFRFVSTTKLWKKYGPHGLARIMSRNRKIPTYEDFTLVDDENNLVDVVKKHVMNKYTRINNSMSKGYIWVLVGPEDMESQKIVENLYSVLRHLDAVKPNDFGTGPKAKEKNRGKYFLKLQLGLTEMGTFDLDMKHIMKELKKLKPTEPTAPST